MVIIVTHLPQNKTQKRWDKADETRRNHVAVEPTGVINRGWYNEGEFPVPFQQAQEQCQLLSGVQKSVDYVYDAAKLSEKVEANVKKGITKFSCVMIENVSHSNSSASNHYISVTLNFDFTSLPYKVEPIFFNSLGSGKIRFDAKNLYYGSGDGNDINLLGQRSVPSSIFSSSLGSQIQSGEIEIVNPRYFAQGIKQVNGNDCGPLAVINGCAAAYGVDPLDLIPGGKTDLVQNREIPEVITDLIRYQHRVGFSLEAYNQVTSHERKDIIRKLTQLRKYEQKLYDEMKQYQAAIDKVKGGDQGWRATYDNIEYENLSPGALSQLRAHTQGLLTDEEHEAALNHMSSQEFKRGYQIADYFGDVILSPKKQSTSATLHQLGHPEPSPRSDIKPLKIPPEIQHIVNERNRRPLLWKSIECTLYEPRLLGDINRVNQGLRIVSKQTSRVPFKSLVERLRENSRAAYNLLKGEASSLLPVDPRLLSVLARFKASVKKLAVKLYNKLKNKYNKWKNKFSERRAYLQGGRKVQNIARREVPNVPRSQAIQEKVNLAVQKKKKQGVRRRTNKGVPPSSIV